MIYGLHFLFYELRKGEERVDFLFFIANPKLVSFNFQEFLDRILSDEIRIHDKLFAYTNTYSSNLENVDSVFNFILINHENWTKVMSLDETLVPLANHFTQESQVEKLETFIQSYPKDKEILNQAVIQAKKNLKWDKERLHELENFFKKDTNGAHLISLKTFLMIFMLCVTMFY